ncbi:zinc finger, CCHC-type containing protein [Tanacetum coccineum]
MNDEYNTLVKNGIWLLVPRPAGVNMVSSMWFFKHKFHADGTLSSYKARLVANGSSQQLGFDFYEIFSPAVKPSTMAIGIPSISPKGTTWYLFDSTPSASNWLERLPTGSISTWEDLTTRFLAQFFPPVRTTKLCNDILIFQQHHGESLSEAWTRFNDLLQKVPHHGIDLWLQVQIFYDHVNPVTRRTIDQSAGGKLCDLNPEESWAILEDLALYDNESYNDPRDFAKLVKEIPLPHDVLSTSDRRLIELETQV